MSAGLDILSSTTNFYRLAKVQEVRFTKYTLTSNEDKSLVDAEVQIRKAFPKAMVVLYSKELWALSINGEDPPSPDPKFGLKESETKTIEPRVLFKSSPDMSPNQQVTLSATLVKAVKKVLMYSLASRKELIPFGNAGLLPNGHEFIQVEPKIVETGDLLISITTRPHKLIPLSEVPPTLEAVNQKYAIHLAPSGIRAYLTGSSIEESLCSHPSNTAEIVESLNALHSIRIDPDTCHWVTLIPNLPHLNGMTAPISDFFKPVQNVKFLTWPLELCVVQESETLRESEVDWSRKFNDPMSLIDDFVKLKTTATTKTPSNVPTSNNTPAEHDLIHHTHRIETPSSRPTPDHMPNTLIATEEAAELNSAKEEEEEDWADLDAELFGADNDEPSFNFFDEPVNSTGSAVVEGGNTPTDLLMLDDDDADLHADLASELEMLAGEDENAQEPAPELMTREDDAEEEDIMDDPYDIPLHEMTIPSTPPYTDPGAPLPVQSPKTISRKRSIFSPLTFNPIIKSNVDDKYANGGKFHVPTDVTPTPTAGDFGIPTVALDDTFGKDSGDEDDDTDEYNDGDDTDESDSEMSQISEVDVLPTRVSPLSGLTENTSIIEGSLEPDSKRLKTGTPTVQALESVVGDSKGAYSPGITSNGTPNIIPFLLRMLQLYTIPEHIYADTPCIPKDNSSSVVDTLLHQIVWDDGCLADVIPPEDAYDQTQSDDFLRAIAQIFPDFHATTLAEYSGVTYTKPSKHEVESPLSSFKAPDYPHAEFITTASPPAKEAIEDSKSLFLIPQPRVRVRRLNQDISINASALHLWNTMSFKSLRKPKDVRVLMVHPQELAEQSGYFLTSFLQIYEKCQLGQTEKMQSSGKLQSGLLPLNFDSDDFEESLVEEAKHLQLPLGRGTNSKDILVLFPDYDQDLKSSVDIVKQFERMKKVMTELVPSKQAGFNVFLKIIPGSFITNNGVFSVVSINRLTRLSLTIYNNIGDPSDTFTSLSTPLPSNIKFELTSRQIAGDILAEDSFIHLAYDRSIDREWFVAAWTDNRGVSRSVKAWSESTRSKEALERVMEEVWNVTLELASKVSGRKYLVLTRLNGMISDDELLQLKRLSSKSKELILIAVSVSHNPRLLLKARDVAFPYNKLFNQEDGLIGGLASINKMESVPTVGSSTGMTPSTIFTPQPSVNSPDLFTIGKSTNAGSPSETRPNDEGSIIEDISDTVHGLISEFPSPLANNRLSAKTGFLMKPVKNSNNKLDAFEVNLLSCPSTFTAWDLMHKLLIQMRNLATLGELYGVADPERSLVPWHVAAVEKAIRCLVHVRVEQEGKL